MTYIWTLQRKTTTIQFLCLSAVSIYQGFRDKNCVQLYYETQFFFLFMSLTQLLCYGWDGFHLLPLALGFPKQLSWISTVWLEIKVCQFCAWASGAWHLTFLLVSLPLDMSWIIQWSKEDERCEEQCHSSSRILKQGHLLTLSYDHQIAHWKGDISTTLITMSASCQKCIE